jgi:endonuclease/exonuclease/phosphatase family metal-dependent hydrolase
VRVRLVTWNVLHGCSPDDGRVDLDRFAAAVRSLDADVLALQEVDRGQSRSGHADLTEVAAQAMGARDRRFVPALVGDPGSWAPPTEFDDGYDDGAGGPGAGGPGAGAPGAAGADATGPSAAASAPSAEALGLAPARDRQGPAYGIALVSRLPVISWRVIRVPPLPRPVPLLLGRPPRPVLVRDEPRVALAARVDTGSGTLTVATTHLSFVPVWNLVQLRRLVRALEGEAGTDPLVLTGDLNTGARRAAWTSGLTGLAAGRTFPAGAPRSQLDHVLGRRVTASEPGVHHLPLSDHRALGVSLRPG